MWKRIQESKKNRDRERERFQEVRERWREIYGDKGERYNFKIS